MKYLFRVIAFFMSFLFFFAVANLCMDPLFLFPYPQNNFESLLYGGGIGLAIIFSVIAGCSCLAFTLSANEQDGK